MPAKDTEWVVEISLVGFFVFFAFRPYSQVGYRLARRFAWVFSALEKPKFHYKRNVLGAFWSFWPPRAPPECPRSALLPIWVFEISPKRTPREPAEASNVPRAPQELPRRPPQGLQEHSKRSQHRPRDPHETGTSKSGSITLATALLREYFQECCPISSKFRIS